jgi:hypothetical protein
MEINSRAFINAKVEGARGNLAELGSVQMAEHGVPVSWSLLQGIQPLAKSTHTEASENNRFCGERPYILDMHGQCTEMDMWSLPGHGSAYPDCGHKRYRGCLNVEGHRQQGLDVDIFGKVHVEWYHRSCDRLECPVCYESAAGLGAHRIAYRLGAVGVCDREKVEGHRSFGRVIHLITSPCKADFGLSYQRLRSKAYKIAKEAGFRGGSAIFHPFRRHPRKGWYFSPHFHMIGYGWIDWSRADFERSGWVVKNIGIRRTVEGTAFYQLTHCGLSVKKGESADGRLYRSVHSVTWFGKLAYNKLRIAPEPEKEHICPICGMELVPLLNLGEPLQGEGSGWFEPGRFVEKVGGWDTG